ncbi:hypothetical protein Aperf_G00000117326 [Anoplocephala perfoliata]
MEYDYSTRRQSVTPSGKTLRRHTFEGSGTSSLPFSLAFSSSPPSSPLLKPPEGSDLFSKQLDKLSYIFGLKRKEMLQSEYFEKWRRHAQLTKEFREIMKVIEHLEEMYGKSKIKSLLTRFNQLKSCVHQVHMFLLVRAVHSSLRKDTALYYSSNMHGSESDLSFQRSLQHGSVIGSKAKEAEGYRQQEEAFESNN